jgi:hypothetical protein
MSYTEEDARMDAWYESLQKEFEEGLKAQSRDAVKAYLGRYGDAIDQRVKGSLAEASALLKGEHWGPALCAAAIAIELMIRFMLVRPLVQGAFLNDEWAEILTARVATGRPGDDREMVPAVLRQWGLDVTKVRGATSSVPVWEFTVDRLFPSRHNYVHRYDPVSRDVASLGLESAEAFRYDIVGTVARQIGFTIEATGKWCQILHPAIHQELEGGMIRTASEWTEDFTPADPRGFRPS